jgi:hypothetical protein
MTWWTAFMVIVLAALWLVVFVRLRGYLAEQQQHSAKLERGVRDVLTAHIETRMKLNRLDKRLGEVLELTRAITVSLEGCDDRLADLQEHRDDRAA